MVFRTPAYDSAIQTDLKTLATKVEMYRIDNDSYPTTGSTLLNSLAFKASKSAYAIAPVTASNLTFCYAENGVDYAAVSLSKSGNIYYILGSQGSRVTKYSGSWVADADNRCVPISGTLSGGTRNYNGYAQADTTTGPWRQWAGGN